MTHTPGPWKVKSEPGQISGDDGDKRWWYSFKAKADQGTFAEHNANAHLMAAAPAMLEALEAVIADPQYGCLGESWNKVELALRLVRR